MDGEYCDTGLPCGPLATQSFISPLPNPTTRGEGSCHASHCPWLETFCSTRKPRLEQSRRLVARGQPWQIPRGALTTFASPICRFVFFLLSLSLRKISRHDRGPQLEPGDALSFSNARSVELTGYYGTHPRPTSRLLGIDCKNVSGNVWLAMAAFDNLDGPGTMLRKANQCLDATGTARHTAATHPPCTSLGCNHFVRYQACHTPYPPPQPKMQLLPRWWYADCSTAVVLANSRFCRTRSR